MISRRIRAKQGRFVETLESRRLLSVTQISFPNFSSTTGLVTNGYGSSATTSANSLVLTDGSLSEARSVLDSTKVPIDTFTSHFSFKIDADGTTSGGADPGQDADGVTFVIDNGSATDLGADGNDIGYSAGTFGADSVALAFNTYNNGAFGSTFGFTSAGQQAASPVTAGTLDLHGGDTFNATVTYNGTTLTISVVDASNSSHTFSDSETVNLAQTLGAHTAYVGFTGATGGDESIQSVSEFDFSGTASSSAPTITSAASFSPTHVTGTKAKLSVTATSNTGGTLSYAWSTLHAPSGAPAPTFTPNSSTSSANTSMHFFKAGTYKVRVTVTDSNGGTSVSDEDIVVQQTPTQIKITPHKAQIVKSTTKQFTATVDDQFGHTLATQPAITYTVASGLGSIGALTGLYTAPSSIGHLVIDASADDLTGVSGETIVS
jgi:hypothetical protein